MLDKLKDNWPAAAVLIAGGIIFLLIALFAPPDVREWLWGANGLLCTVIALFQRSPGDRRRVRESTPPAPTSPPGSEA